jgi:hypothetical protein
MPLEALLLGVLFGDRKNIRFINDLAGKNPDLARTT